MIPLTSVITRRHWCTSVLAPLALAFAGCGDNPSTAENPKPLEKRGKYLETHPPEPDPNFKPKKKGARKAR